MLKKSYPSTVSAPVAFVGLGTMGYPMAGHLKKAGHEVCVFNRTKAKAEAWQKEFQGKTGTTPKDAASGAQFVFLCVGNDDDVRSVVYGENGVLAGMALGSILVDHTTTSAVLAREISEKCAEKGVSFVDAPASDVFSRMEGVQKVEELGPGKFRIHFADAQEVIDQIVKASAAGGWRLSEIRVEKSSLDNIFAELSKKTQK